MKRSAALFALAVGAAAVPAWPLAADDGYLPVAAAAERLADGRPWAALTPEGRRAEITLQPDGTGRFRGPLTLSVAWRVAGENLCLDISIAGTKCLRFRAIDGGLQAYADGKPDLALTR
jgi:hypothetical protein